MIFCLFTLQFEISAYNKINAVMNGVRIQNVRLPNYVSIESIFCFKSI